MIVSLGTLVVISYQTMLINAQTELIRQEQRIAVMPYLEFSIVNPKNEETWMEIRVGNSGLRPAFIKKVEVAYKDEDYTDQLSDFYLAYFNPGNMFYNKMASGMVVQSGESITIFGVAESSDHIIKSIETGEVTIRFIYESAYGETWVLQPFSTQPTKISEPAL